MSTALPTSTTNDLNYYLLLILGAALLGTGLYVALARHGGLTLVLILMGGSIAAFATVAFLLAHAHQLRRVDSTHSSPQALSASHPASQKKSVAAPEPLADSNKITSLKSVARVASNTMLLPASRLAGPAKHDASKVHDGSTDDSQIVNNGVNNIASNIASNIANNIANNKAGIAVLMETPLGDLLLAALLKDPESAGHVIAQAILAAQAPAPVRQE